MASAFSSQQASQSATIKSKAGGFYAY